MSYVFRDYILTLALYSYCTMYICEFKHRWYQISKADYCLKHFKLVLPKFLKLFSGSSSIHTRPAEQDAMKVRC